VARSQDVHGIAGHFRSSRDLRQRPAVGTAEPKVAIGLPIDRVPLLGAGPGRDLHDATVAGVLHHHAAGVAGQAPRRFRGKVFAVLEHRQAEGLGIGERRRVDVDHHLVATRG
jgi:hypothetical protein